MFYNGSKFYSTNNYIVSHSCDSFLYAVRKWFQSSREDINSKKGTAFSCKLQVLRDTMNSRSIELKAFFLPIWPTKVHISWVPADVTFLLIFLQQLASMEQQWWLEKVSPLLSRKHFSPAQCHCVWVASGSPGGMCTLGRFGCLLCSTTEILKLMKHGGISIFPDGWVPCSLYCCNCTVFQLFLSH